MNFNIFLHLSYTVVVCIWMATPKNIWSAWKAGFPESSRVEILKGVVALPKACNQHASKLRVRMRKLRNSGEAKMKPPPWIMLNQKYKHSLLHGCRPYTINELLSPKFVKQEVIFNWNFYIISDWQLCTYLNIKCIEQVENGSIAYLGRQPAIR